MEIVRGYLCTSDPCSVLRNDRREETGCRSAFSRLSLMNPEVLLSEYCHTGGAWPEQMVEWSICCRGHGASICFDEHGVSLSVSWRSWPGPMDVFSSSLGLETYLYSDSRAFLLRKIPSSLSWLPDKWEISIYLKEGKLLGLEAGERSQTRGQGPVTGGRNPNLGAGTRDPKAGTRTLGEGT
ncbi:hypothetical protein F2Q68_00033950 [Brassica cretica]|uniref:Uncharacterized protein n=1 Tax=Brassica cretica TaxID=69181 RepID=A0A8S9GY31_BRACR|nr:hypothetical protein F2Q68_00033950 [Brassica cretica]